MPVSRTLISGSPYLGVYLKAADHAVVLSPSVPSATVRELERLLGVPSVRTTVGACEIAGSLVALNAHGVIVNDDVDDAEVAVLTRVAPVVRLSTRFNAIGNNILAN
ncbi:MAG TPA: translation initiation factor IF-6, partial [Thermoplasmata archaeon]